MIEIVPKTNNMFDVISNNINEKWQIKINGNFNIPTHEGVGTVRNIPIFSFNDIFYGKIYIKGNLDCLKKEYDVPFFGNEVINFEVTPEQIYTISGETTSFAVKTSHGATFTYDKDILQLNPEEVSSGFNNVTVSTLINNNSLNYITIKENSTNILKELKIENILPRDKFLNAFYLNGISLPTSYDILLTGNNEFSFYVISSNELTISDDNDMMISSSANDVKYTFKVKVINGATTILLTNSDGLSFSFRLTYFL